jgi:GT2 family glycosyltransferase
MERVSVIIPNWNGSAILAGCLQSLRRQTFGDFVTYVVDNGSVDDSVAMMKARFPEVRVMAQMQNLGFCVAMNMGIAAGHGEFVVALNNDTEVHPAWLAELVAAMDDSPAIGFATSKILDFSDRTIIDTVGDSYAFWGVSYKIGSRHRDTNTSREPFEVFGASGAASIYRRSMLDTIGCFDPDFFAYMEDVDLSIRARLAGYRCLSVPSAIVYHMGAATTGGTTSAFSVRLTVRNGISLIIKDMPLPLLPVVLASTLVAQGGAVALSLIPGRLPWLRRNLPAYGQGLLEAARAIPASWRKRRAVSNTRRVSWHAFWRLMSASVRMSRNFPSMQSRGDR